MPQKTKRVLLIEPGYGTKYPPLGLMKISTFHKAKGDEVVFYKGTNAALRDQDWETIYITSLFTFKWKITVDTIKFYQRNKFKSNIQVGGILASLLKRDLENETGIESHFGLWDEVDNLRPDYTILDEHDYYLNDSSIAYTTKGCPNHCSFCAVPILEPKYVDYIPLKNQLDDTKKDLILLDNNVLASSEFERIIKDIKINGFYKGAKFGRGQRRVDFNQGIDARLLTEQNMFLLSQIPIFPLRIAFDDVKLIKTYINKIRLASKFGIRRLSNYLLFNFKDTPDDLYSRLRINIELNEELGLNIFSFPMKYVPLDAKDRSYIGKNWTKTQLRGIQCILHATHGVVGPKKPFFEKAFGETADEFKYIISQPEEKIFDRSKMREYAI
jgi:hypothetical protein